jgi:hypothetical protein
MRPVFSTTLAGFAVATSLWANRAQAGCAVDTDCLDNGLACGTDVCNKSGACVPAGTDPGTCNSQSSCKCYGLYSVLCNPENHSCTITSADGGINSGGGAQSGSAYVPPGGDDGGGATGADDSGSAATDMDAAASQGSGSTSGTGSAGESSGTLAASTGSGGNATSAGASSGASTSGQAATASDSSPPAAKSSSGCSIAFGQGRAPVELLGIAIGVCALLGRRRRSAI